jgi:hypothetical protein
MTQPQHRSVTAPTTRLVVIGIALVLAMSMGLVGASSHALDPRCLISRNDLACITVDGVMDQRVTAAPGALHPTSRAQEATFRVSTSGWATEGRHHG